MSADGLGAVLEVARHEMVHGLGFASWHYAYFRDSDGNPLTPRDTAGAPARTTLSCDDGSTWRFPMPADNTVNSFQERG